MRRHFLFLQGVASPFFGRLADHLEVQGHLISRINFCAGDALYWGRRPAERFRDAVDCLPDYLSEQFARRDYSDLVLFGSRRPIHLPAVRLAENAGIRVHVFEEGYVRPNWLTLERGGVNADSPLPRDPAWYLQVDRSLPRCGNGEPVQADIRVRAAHDFAYHVANCLNPVRFPGYRTHRPYSAAVEYAGWARRFSALQLRRRRDANRIQDLIAAGTPYFVLPLQLNGDTQITLHSRYGGMPQVIDAVLRSFADDAPPDSRLVIKNHPLDTGLVDYSALLAGLERELDLQGRILYLETGHLPVLLERALGVVTVNSTVGMLSLAHHCPTVAMGNAIYDLPGLTFQGRLAEFWTQRAPPDRQLFRAFRNTVVYATQVNGDFYTAPGIRMAVSNCDRLLAPESPLEALVSRFPTERSAAPQAART